MIKLIAKSLELPNGVEHIATDWEVSTSHIFAPGHTVASSFNDRVNLREIVFNVVLDPTIKYYARARILHTNGWTIWGSVDIFVPVATEDLELETDMPSGLSVPIITTTSVVNNHVATMFDIMVSGFDTLGTGVHVATTWLIESMNGDIVWEKPYDTINKDKISVTDIILRDNRIYRIKALFHSSSNDVSQIATKTIKTGNNSNVKILNFFDDIVVDEDYVVRLSYLPNIVETTWKLQLFKNNITNTVWEKHLTSGDVLTAVIPSGTFIPGNVYILSVMTNLDTVPLYVTIGVDLHQNNNPILANTLNNFIISSDEGNILTIGSDGGLYVPSDYNNLSESIISNNDW